MPRTTQESSYPAQWAEPKGRENLSKGEISRVTKIFETFGIIVLRCGES